MNIGERIRNADGFLTGQNIGNYNCRYCGKRMRGVAHIRSEKAIRKEATKCDVVCANCHRIRTWKEKYNVKPYQ